MLAEGFCNNASRGTATTPGLIALLVLLTVLSCPVLASGPSEGPPSETSVPPELHPILEPLRSGDGDRALAEARSLADEWAGDPEFQYLYGLAAIEAGKYSEAIMALDAVLMVQPDNQRAHLELARAHFQSGNWLNARHHFEYVLRKDPPEQVKQNIQRFLDRINTNQQKTDASFQLEGRYSLGHDSNINSATSSDTVSLDLFNQTLELELPDDNTETDDAFQAFGLNAQYRRPLNQRRGLSVSADAHQTDHFSQNAYDLTRFHLGSSYYQRIGDNQQFQLSAKGHQINLDNERLRWQAGLEGSIQHFIGTTDRVSASLGVSAQRYPDRHERDVDRAQVSVNSTHRNDRWHYQLSLLGGIDAARDSDNEQFGRWFTGLSAGTGWSLAARHELDTSVIYRFSHYDEKRPLFNERRQDRETIITAVWRWNLLHRLTLESEVSYQRSDSNIEFFDYDRLQGRIGIRYQFFRG